ncbi:UNVERIFIED_CONTAM: Cilia- and flagella-associated protein 47 [Siphonaria sp. JEL0065]|nr:Cilia- and flagella-associated protein 47 [Siphonaria sp. JEL0065]
MMMVQRPFKSPCGVILGGDLQRITENLDKTANTLMKWIAEHIGSPPNTVECPLQFSRFHGKMLLDLIQSLSSKKRIIGATMSASSFGSLTGVERVRSLYKTLNETLSGLTSAGALLSSVKPEFLMTVEDFRLYVTSQMDTMQANNKGASVHDEYVAYLKQIEAHFQIITKEAWISVISQVIKIYALQIITPKHFRALPGISSDEVQLNWPIISKGNIYSTSEAILLRWASYHMWKRNSILTRLTNFGDDFKAYQLEANVKIVNGALKEVFKTSTFSLPVQQTIYAENPLENLLLLLFLYQTLPQFISKGAIEFHGALHASVTQGVELSNPSSRTLTYTATLTGDNEFCLPDGDVFTLNGRGQTHVGVQFTSRFSRNASGQLKLASKRMSLNNASIIVFDLAATVDPPVPKKIHTMDAQIYCTPPTQIGVEVTNPFNSKAVFRVSLIQSRSYAPLRVPQRGQPDTEIPYIEVLGGENVTPAAYRSTVKTVNLEPYASTTFPLTFQPFEPGLHKCIIHLTDEEVGEFQYQVEGRVKSPVSVDMLWSCKAHTTLEKSIRVIPVNAAREKALHSVLHDEASRMRLSIKSKGKDAPVFLDRDKYQVPKQTLRYKVDYLSPYFKGPPELMLKQNLYSKKQSFNVEQNYTELHVAFCPKDPGKYTCKVVLTCIDIPDVRVFKVQGIAISEGSKADLEMQTPARQHLVQEIPIVNKTDDDWNIKATIEGSSFTGAANIVARPRTTTYYSLSFCPPKSGEIAGLLTLANAQTSQKYMYSLRGIGLEPLPEDNREVECIARDTVSETFQVYNNSDEDVEFDVLTDLPNNITKPSIIVPAKSTIPHTIQFRSIKVGAHLQLVTFVNRKDQSYIWFIVRLNVLPSPAVEILELKTAVRTAVAADILIVNPYDKQMVYNVTMLGEGLIGSKEVVIEPKSEENFVLTYAPLITKKSIGSLIFNNEEVGEFWYELHMEALDSPPVIVPQMLAPLGKCGVSSELGDFKFYVQGRGLMPEPMTDVTVRSPLRKSTTSVISFVNPLIDPIPVTVRIVEEEKALTGVETKHINGIVDQEFALMLNRKPKHHVGGLDTLDIPFMYCPQRMIGRAATILVEMGQLRWIYPIMGLPDAPVPSMPKYYECRAREVLQVTHELVLNEFNFDVEEVVSRTIEDWNKILALEVEVVSVSNVTKDNVKSSLTFKLIDVKDMQEEGLALKFSVSYAPTKSGSANVLFSIHQTATGGRWRFPISLASLPPLVDDTITIEGAINKLSAVSFKLKNSAEHARKFKAYFVSPVSPEFSVVPTEGTLWPETVKGSGDNMFVVGYKASSYGKMLVGTLVIECDDVSWSYEVRGTTPQTRLPSAQKSTILPAISDAKHDKKKRPKKNFLKENAGIVKLDNI